MQKWFISAPFAHRRTARLRSNDALKAAAPRCGFFVVVRSVWQGLLLALLLAFSFTATQAAAQKGRWYPDDEPAPALKLKTVADAEMDIATLKGRVVIVNFWATWCGPCIAEMPSLQTLAAKLGDRNVALLGVNYHESAEKIRDFQTKYRVNFPLLRDPWQEASGTWKVRVLPTTFIVDANGIVRWRVVGEVDWSDREVERRLRALIKPR